MLLDDLVVGVVDVEEEVQRPWYCEDLRDRQGLMESLKRGSVTQEKPRLLGMGTSEQAWQQLLIPWTRLLIRWMR